MKKLLLLIILLPSFCFSQTTSNFYFRNVDIFEGRVKIHSQTIEDIITNEVSSESEENIIE